MSKKFKEVWLTGPKSYVQQCNVVYSEKHLRAWRNTLARDMNVILGQAARSLESGSPEDYRFVQAVLRVVKRVAEFEDIQTAKEPK